MQIAVTLQEQDVFLSKQCEGKGSVLIEEVLPKRLQFSLTKEAFLQDVQKESHFTVVSLTNVQKKINVSSHGEVSTSNKLC